MAEDFNSLLALLQRTTDTEGWLAPMLDDADSNAILSARISIFARLGPGVDHNGAQGLISDASGGAGGVCSLNVSRTTGTTTGTIPKGYPFVDARGIRATLLTDVVVLAAQLVKGMPLITDRTTELVNTEDDPIWAVDPTAPVIPGSSGILIAPAGTGGMTTDTFQTIGPSTPITGAAADYLSVHGSERTLPRQPGEMETDYRQRIRNISDAVSPIAVADVVQAAAQMPGLPAFKTLEPFEDGATPALKDLHGLGSFPQYFVDDYDALNPNTDHGCFLDDLIELDRLADRRTATAYLEIRAQDFLRDEGGAVLFLDDGFLNDPVLGFPDLVDGVPPETLAALLAIIAHVTRVKAAGVNVDLFLKEPTQETSYGTRSAAVFGAVANFTPAPGTIWVVEEVIASHEGPDPTVPVDHFIEYDLEDGGLFATPVFSKSWSERVALPNPSQRVTAMRGFLRSDGVMVANLAVSVKVLEMVL